MGRASPRNPHQDGALTPPSAAGDTYTRWTHKVTQPHTESQTTILQGSTQPQAHKSRGTHQKAVMDTWGDMPQKNHTALGSQTCPNTHHHNQSRAISERATP